jgi:surface protein
MRDRQGLRAARRLLPALVAALVALAAALAVPGAALAEDVTARPGSQVTVRRLYNRWSGEHLFTTDEREYEHLQTLGWRGEGTAWVAPASGDTVWRLYNPYSGDHFYTMDRGEYDHLGSIGWNKEGEGFHSAPEAGGTPVYRLFNPWLTQGTHLFTTDAGEYDHLGSIGWRKEDVAWYGVGGGPYRVEFRSWDEGRGEEAVVSSAEYMAGDPVEVPDPPERDGYEFRGWGDGVEDGMACSGDATYLADWAPVAPADYATEEGVEVSGVSFDEGVRAPEGGAVESVADDGTLTVSVPAGEVDDIAPGDVLVLDKDDLVNGTAVRVASVRANADGSATVTGTAPDDVTEVLDSVSIEVDGDLADMDFVPGPGVTEDGAGSLAAASDDVRDDFTERVERSLTVDFAKIAKGADDKTAKEIRKDWAKDRHLSVKASTGKIKVGYGTTFHFAYRLPPDGSGVNPVQTLTFEDTSFVVRMVALELSGRLYAHLGYGHLGPVVLDFDLGVKGKATASCTAGLKGCTFGHDSTGRFPNTDPELLSYDPEVDGELDPGLNVGALVGIYKVLSCTGEADAGVKVEGSETLRDTGMKCRDLAVGPNLALSFEAEAGPVKRKVEYDLTALFPGKLASALEAKRHWEDGTRVPDCTWGNNKVVFVANGTVVKVVKHATGDKLLRDAPTEDSIGEGLPADLRETARQKLSQGYGLAGWRRRDDPDGPLVGADDEFGGERTVLDAEWGDPGASGTSVASGTFGEGCSWRLDDDGTLTVFPTDGRSGTMGRLWDAVEGNTGGVDVKSVRVKAGVRAPQDSFSLFSGVPATAIDAAGLDVSGVTNMEEMFYGCSSLSDVSPLSGWDTSSVTGMSWMFEGCSSLSDVSPLSGWDTSSVTHMSQMFGGCSLSDVSPLSGWDTSSVTDMSRMFEGCPSLSDVSPLSNWKTYSVTNMRCMFARCDSLSDATPLEGWKVSYSANKYGAFPDGCRAPSWYAA